MQVQLNLTTKEIKKLQNAYLHLAEEAHDGPSHGIWESEEWWMDLAKKLDVYLKRIPKSLTEVDFIFRNSGSHGDCFEVKYMDGIDGNDLYTRIAIKDNKVYTIWTPDAEHRDLVLREVEKYKPFLIEVAEKWRLV